MALSRSHSGQILLPLLAGCLAMIAFTMLFIRWGNHALWTLRMKLAADAAAISCAREQSELLNQIAAQNTFINTDLAKFGLFGNQKGVISRSAFSRYVLKTRILENYMRVFPARSARTGYWVAKLNGATNVKYFPRLSTRLKRIPIHLLVINPFPVPPNYEKVDTGYVARLWNPGHRQAQPTHKTLWLAQRKGAYGMGSARLWLDVQPSAWIQQNGGFPRVKESFLGDIGIQSFYPQFRARSLPRPLYSVKQFILMMAGERFFE